MNILILAGAYPYSMRPSSGIFNEKCVKALKDMGHQLVVVAPRPYVPSFLKKHSRWKMYSCIEKFQMRNGVPVFRPAMLVIPRLGAALWVDSVAYYTLKGMIRNLHDNKQFDVLLSFDLSETGGVAWRIGRELQIPSCGWAFGEDVRFKKTSGLGKVVSRALRNLNLIFYQSRELLEVAAKLLDRSMNLMSKKQHVVLSHGIPEPPFLDKKKTSSQIRAELGIEASQIVVTFVGRIVKEKGIFELVKSVSSAILQNPRLICLMIGSVPSFDNTKLLEKFVLEQSAIVHDKIKILPACNHHRVWEILCGTDIFVFPSHREGMPNSLLEAMALGVPGIAFGIPPVLEIDSGKGTLLVVPPFDSAALSDAILALARSPEKRKAFGAKGMAEVKARFMVKKNMTELIDLIAQMKTNLKFS